MSIRAKIADLFIDNGGPNFLILASGIVIVILMIQEVLTVIRP